MNWRDMVLVLVGVDWFLTMTLKLFVIQPECRERGGHTVNLTCIKKDAVRWP